MVSAIASVVGWLVVWGTRWLLLAAVAYVASMLVMLGNSER